LTNIEKAIECIKTNGGVATSAQLHAALGLKPEEYASSYLTDGVRDGRLLKDGKEWRVGPLSTAPEVFTGDVVVNAPPIMLEATEPKKPQPNSERPTFACALWSDGDLSMVRDGETVAVLTPPEVTQLRRYLAGFTEDQAIRLCGTL
jgi:hypothetical protein